MSDPPAEQRSDHRTDARPVALAYDAPLAPGQVRPDRPGDGSLAVDVGPQPAGRLLAAVAPLAAVFGVLCVALAALLGSALLGSARPPGFAAVAPAGPAVDGIDVTSILLLPAGLVWAFVGLELALQLREASVPVRLTVSADGVLAFPYPWPRSPVERVRADDVARLGVATRRSWLLRRPRAALEVRLRRGATFALLPGYPRATLEAACDLLGPALGMDVAAVATTAGTVAATETAASAAGERPEPDSACGRGPTPSG